MNKLFLGGMQSSSVVLRGREPCLTDSLRSHVGFPPSSSERPVGLGCCRAPQVPSGSLLPPAEFGSESADVRLLGARQQGNNLFLFLFMLPWANTKGRFNHFGPG